MLFKKLPNQKIQCRACNHFCVIEEGKRGICGVRENQKGELKLLVYGKPIAINIDPIEKKPLYHFLPGTEIFSIGTVGCNFRCPFCQNWDISQFKLKDVASVTQTFRSEKISQPIRSEDLSYKESGKSSIPYQRELSPKQIVEYCLENNIPSVAYTYNEPTIFLEYAYDTAKLGRVKGLKNVFHSNGFTSREGVEKIAPVLDATNIDLKSFQDDFYQKHCGARLKPVLENIQLFWELGVWVEVTTLIIPGENDSKEELQQIAEFLVKISPSLPWHVSRFYPQYKMLDRQPTPVRTLQQAYDIGKKAGLRYVYVGNILDAEREHTYCHKCSKIVIERSGYTTHNHLVGDRCPFCKEEIPGIFQI